MKEQHVTDLVLGVVVLGLLIFRQLVPRQIRESSLRLVLILLVIGLVLTVQFLQQHHGSGVTVASLAGSLVLAAGFGALRARRYGSGCRTAPRGPRATG